MSVAIVLFTGDLRVHDQAALTAATLEYESVVPPFVLDDALLRDAATPNRVSFLLDSLRDLWESLRGLGGDLVVRCGDVVTEVTRHEPWRTPLARVAPDYPAPLGRVA